MDFSSVVKWLPALWQWVRDKLGKSGEPPITLSNVHNCNVTIIVQRK